MKKYAIIINEETKQCDIGLGTNTAYYQSIGMVEMEVEQAYNGCWYVEGHAPQKPQEVKEQQTRAIRNSYLVKFVDPKQLVLVWSSLTEDEQKEYTDYRQYLLDYPETENWYEQPPKDFSTWKVLMESDNIEQDDEEIVDSGA